MDGYGAGQSGLVDSTGPVTRQSRRTPNYRRVETRGEAKQLEKQIEKLVEKEADKEAVEILKRIRTSDGKIDVSVQPNRYHESILVEYLSSGDPFRTVSALNYLTSWSVLNDHNSARILDPLFTDAVFRACLALLHKYTDDSTTTSNELYPKYPDVNDQPEDGVMLRMGRENIGHYSSGIEHNDYILNMKSKLDILSQECIWAMSIIFRNLALNHSLASHLRISKAYISGVFLMTRHKATLISINALQVIASIGHRINILDHDKLDDFVYLAFLARAQNTTLFCNAVDAISKVASLHANEFAIHHLPDCFYQLTTELFATSTDLHIIYVLLGLFYRLSTLGKHIRKSLAKQRNFVLRLLGLARVDAHPFNFPKIIGPILIHLSQCHESVRYFRPYEEDIVTLAMEASSLDEIWPVVLHHIASGPD